MSVRQLAVLMNHQLVIERTRRWIATVVIDLNLCPFARRVFDNDLIRYVVTEAADSGSLFQVLSYELVALAAVPSSEVETTLLIHPFALGEFLAYNDFLGDADRLIGQLGLTGIIQIASFHPAYRFADAEPDAVENYTNRSPYPMLHLLREESVTRVSAEMEDLAEIPRRNVVTLQALGLERMLERLKAIHGMDALENTSHE